jgi:hypothetical protein
MEEKDIVISADIMEYLGKYEDGVLVLLSVNFNGQFSEGTIYYSDKALALTVDESIEKELGKPIEFWSGYRDLLISILKKVVPYNEIINRLDEIDFGKYFGDVNLDSSEDEGEDVDDSDIKREE